MEQPIRVRVFLQTGLTCHGALFQKSFMTGGLIKSGQIWIKFDTSLGMTDAWLLDASILSIDIIAPERSDSLFI